MLTWGIEGQISVTSFTGLNVSVSGFGSSVGGHTAQWRW